MLHRILEVLRSGAPTPPPADARSDTDYDRVLAVCALLVEMAMIDGEFSVEERGRITAAMRDRYGIRQDDLERIVEEAEREARQATSYWQLTRVLNEHYNRDEKIAIVELLWNVIHADGSVDKHEDYLVKKLAKLLNVSHAEMIAAKLRSRSA